MAELLKTPEIGDNHVEAASTSDAALNLTAQRVNPKDGEAQDAAPVSTASFDVKTRIFTTSEGIRLTLTKGKLNRFVAERIFNGGKPEVPRKEVLLLRKYKQIEANPNDPGYLALLAEWESKRKIDFGVYLLSLGIADTVPSEFIEDNTTYLPDANPQEMKYMWVCSLMSEDDLNALIELLSAQLMPTAQGLKQSADSFQR